MPHDTPETHPERKEIARFLLGRGSGQLAEAVAERTPLLESQAYARAGAGAARPPISFPDGLAPTPLVPPAGRGSDDPLPKADVVVITWTVDELAGLARVLTPGVDPAKLAALRPHFEPSTSRNCARTRPPRTARAWAATS